MAPPGTRTRVHPTAALPAAARGRWRGVAHPRRERAGSAQGARTARRPAPHGKGLLSPPRAMEGGLVFLLLPSSGAAQSTPAPHTPSVGRRVPPGAGEGGPCRHRVKLPLKPSPESPAGEFLRFSPSHAVFKSAFREMSWFQRCVPQRSLPQRPSNSKLRFKVL